MREHDTKTTPVFLPAGGEAYWSLLSSVSLLSGNIVQPESTYSHILKVMRVQVSSVIGLHLPKTVSTDLTNPVFQCLWDKLSQG